MEFDPAWYGPGVSRILALGENGKRLLPLTWNQRPSEDVRSLLSNLQPAQIFPGAPEPRAAMAGLWLYFDCFDEAHQAADSCENPNGYFWQAIVHRREGDSGNAAYWFRKTGAHPVYEPLAAEAAKIIHEFPKAEFRVGAWDPYAFVMFCERAREQPASDQERAAQHIQRAEWQLLFDRCARPR
ncbi:MAG: hypothetical protein JO307_13425 [Bryobacterales bacterium]|nr:hypothetical protein [Bryobacterales bacterium]